MIIVSRATKNAGKCYCGGHPEDERIRVAGLFAAAFQSPRHGQTTCNNLSLIQGYNVGCDHIDLAAAMVVQILDVQFSDADVSFHASHSARRLSSINTLDR